jgi:uncharacterized protein YutE (UPF0331/DUF86 family)
MESSTDVNRMAARLARLPAQRRALHVAMSQFGDDFDLDAWEQAFTSADEEAINAVYTVTGGYQALINNTIELVKTGTKLVGVEPVSGMPGASGLIEAVQRDGGISRQQATTFIELYRTRNRLQHASLNIDADEVHRQVRLLRKHLPKFIKSFTDWLASRGVTLGGDALP